MPLLLLRSLPIRKLLVQENGSSVYPGVLYRLNRRIAFLTCNFQRLTQDRDRNARLHTLQCMAKAQFLFG